MVYIISTMVSNYWRGRSSRPHSTWRA